LSRENGTKPIGGSKDELVAVELLMLNLLGGFSSMLSSFLKPDGSYKFFGYF
jgi:hypothetical protein